MTVISAAAGVQEPETSSQSSPDASHPYLGLRPFTEPDRHFFFGRDHDRDELYRFVRRHVLTVLFGASGLGKTSLLSAGLFPLLRGANYLPIRIELNFAAGHQAPVEQVIARIRAEVEAQCVDTGAPGSGKTLWEYFHRTHFWSNKNNQLLTPVLVFDQFEETTRHGSERGVKALLIEMADLIENRIPARVRQQLEKTGDELDFVYEIPRAKVIISLREDFLAELEDLKTLIPSLSGNRFRLTQMNGEQALEAVTRPAQDKALVTRQVAEKIVRFVVSEGKSDAQSGDGEQRSLAELIVEPSLLSLVCDQLNRRRIEKQLPAITADLLQRSKGSILSDFYEDSLLDCDEKVREFIEDKLLTKAGFRTSMALEDALKEGVEKHDIDTLVQKRILRLEEHLGHRHVQLMHDRLTGVIGESRKLRQEKRRQLAEQQQREEAFKREKEDLERQRAAQKKRSITILRTVIGVCVLVVAVLGWYFTEERRTESEARRTDSEAAALWLHSERLLKSADPQAYVKSLLLVTESLKKRNTPAASTAWARAVSALPPYSVELAHDEAVATAVFQTNDGLVTGSGNKVTWWEVNEAAQISVAAKQTQLLSGLTVKALSPDGTLVAATDTYENVWISNSATGEREVKLKNIKAPRLLAFSTTGRYLALNTGDKYARIFSTQNGKELKKFEHENWVTSQIFNGDDKYLVTGGSEGLARVWDVENGLEVESFAHDSTPIQSVAVSADSQYLASTSNTDNYGRVVIWKMNAQSRVPLGYSVFKDLVTHVLFNPSGRELAVISGDWASILRIDTGEQQELMRFPLRTQAGGQLARFISYDPSGQRLVTVKSGEARIWEIGAYRHPLSLLDLESSVTALEISPDSQHFATASNNDSQVRLWDVKTGEAVRSFPGEIASKSDAESRISALSFSPDGAQLAAASVSKRSGLNIEYPVRIWEVKSGNEVANFDPQGFVVTVDFSADGDRLVTTSSKHAQVWDLQAAKDQPPIALKHDEIVTSVMFQPGGKFLATASGSSAQIWDWQSKNQIQRFDHEQRVAAIAFGPGGDVLATASGNLVTIRSVESGETVKTLALDAAIRDVRFSLGAKLLATTGYDNQVGIWDPSSFEQPIQLPHKHAVNAGDFTPDGKRYLSATSTHGRSVVWDWPLETEQMIVRACSVLPRDLSEEEWRIYFSGENQRPVCDNLRTRSD